MDKYKNDPTNDFETFKEETNEDRYYALELTQEQAEVIEAYVNDFEKRIRAKNEIAKQLYDTVQEHQTYYKSLLTKLIKL